jgi:hypothetical protein
MQRFLACDFFHQTTPSGPLIQGIKPFWDTIRFTKTFDYEIVEFV